MTTAPATPQGGDTRASSGKTDETVVTMSDSQFKSLLNACAEHNSALESTATSANKSATTQKEPPPKPPFVYPDYKPHMEAIDGVTFDFNLGVRLLAPETMPRRLHCRITDMESRSILHDNELQPKAYILGSKKFYMKYKIELFDELSHKRLWLHEMDLKDRDVLLQMPYEGAIGDSIAWFSFVERFQLQNKCKVHLVMPDRIRELVERQYPDIHFIKSDEARPMRPYAAYYIGLFFGGDQDWQPYDFRHYSLASTVGNILDVKDMSDIPPRFDLSKPRLIQERYVCLGTHGSSHTKCWNNPAGWRIVTDRLKKAGYRVLCIDKEHEAGSGDVWHSIPYGSEDFTGDRPLQERIDIIKDADFFIGLSSGLSWLAWGCNVPVVLIGGFTMPFADFYTPYRVQARHACIGCWNDMRYNWDNKDYMWCPKYKDTPRAYECTKAISPEMVLDVIAKIPNVLKLDG